MIGISMLAPVFHFLLKSRVRVFSLEQRTG
jgi:hypothetical protein